MKYPEIKEDEFLLFRSDSMTGNILDDELKLKISESQNIFTVFNSKEKAVKYAKEIKRNETNIEVTILNFIQNVIYYDDGLK